MENRILFLLPFLLTASFVSLKLLGMVSWPWLWILSPIWIVLVFIGALVSVIHLLSCYWEAKEEKCFRKIQRHSKSMDVA